MKCASSGVEFFLELQTFVLQLEADEGPQLRGWAWCVVMATEQAGSQFRPVEAFSGGD